MPDRAKKQIVILHGWSDNAAAFRPLAKFLEERGFHTLDLFLADYISRHGICSLWMQATPRRSTHQIAYGRSSSLARCPTSTVCGRW